MCALYNVHFSRKEPYFSSDFLRCILNPSAMSKAQKEGHAQPLFTKVHAINSFLAFPFMGIVEYVTLKQFLSMHGIEMQLTETCI